MKSICLPYWKQRNENIKTSVGKQTIWGKWWSFPGKISCSFPYQLFQITQIFLSASKEQHS